MTRRRRRPDGFISSPDPLTHLRRLCLLPAAPASPAERRYRDARALAEAHAARFWAANNARFAGDCRAFEQAVAAREGRAATADELARVYRAFLDRHRAQHAAFQRRWLRMAASIVWLGALAWLSRRPWPRALAERAGRAARGPPTSLF